MKTIAMSVDSALLTARDSEVSIAIVVPFDEVIDHEYWMWAPGHVVWHFTRTPWNWESGRVGLEMAAAVSEPNVIRDAVRSVAHTRSKVVAYGCTSGSFVGGIAGERALRANMISGGIGTAVTTSGALLQALNHLECERPAVVTPYEYRTAVSLVSYLEEGGLVVTAVGYLGLENRIEEVPLDITEELIKKTFADTDADSVVVSCTNLRTFGIISKLENELGVPIITANQATAWSALNAAGVSIPSLGQRLFP